MTIEPELLEIQQPTTGSIFKSAIMTIDEALEFIGYTSDMDISTLRDNEDVKNTIENLGYKVYSLNKSYPEYFK